MSNSDATKRAQYEPRRDQPMPSFSYPSQSAQNQTLTVRSASESGNAGGRVLVNGLTAY